MVNSVKILSEKDKKNTEGVHLNQNDMYYTNNVMNLMPFCYLYISCYLSYYTNNGSNNL